MPALTNSTTTVQKATCVPLTIEAPKLYIGKATLKFGYIRQLNLQPGEVDTVRRNLAKPTASKSGPDLARKNIWSLLRKFEGTPSSLSCHHLLFSQMSQRRTS